MDIIQMDRKKKEHFGPAMQLLFAIIECPERRASFSASKTLLRRLTSLHNVSCRELECEKKRMMRSSTLSSVHKSAKEEALAHIEGAVSQLAHMIALLSPEK